MTLAELLELQAQQRKELAEKHLKEWQQHNASALKETQQKGDTPQLRAEIDKRAATFRTRTSQETRDLDTRHAYEANSLDRMQTIIDDGRRNATLQDRQAPNLEKNREAQLQKQQAQVKEEYQKYQKEADKAEKQEKYNQNNLSSNAAMEPAAEKRQQEPINETERERLKRELKEQMKMAQQRNKQQQNER